MTQKQLDRLVSRWQARLLMHDWGVCATLTRDSKMGVNVGTAEWDWDAMTCAVRISDARTPKEAELDLVHELLHALTDDPNVERKLNLLAAAFCGAYARR